ncbi:MAG: transposase [Bacteroidia bacterium]|nr:transposase [Bacteroidia bacterium]
MSRKGKVSYEEKVKACESYLNGTTRIFAITQSLGVSKRAVLNWINKYRNIGKEALITSNNNKTYTKEFKEQVVIEYLGGNGSQEYLCNKYQISSHSILQRWIKQYNTNKELKDYDPKPEVYTKMANRKNTTKDERIEIVHYCIDHNKDYKGTATKYDVSYAQVFNWVKKYLENGDDGLNDKRGRRKQESELSELETLQRKNKILENKLREKEMEVILLKKLKEVEGRRYSPKQSKKRNT